MSNVQTSNQSNPNTGMGIVGAVAHGIDTGMGFVRSNQDNKKNRQNARDAMQWQEESAMRLSEFNRQQQMKLWEDTNAAAQRKQYEKAGLNVGLMYDAGGAGGATAAATSSGVSGSIAPVKTDGGMGIGKSVADMAMLANMDAQRKLIEAQTENVNADTENKGTVERENIAASTEKMMQEIRSDKARQTMQEMLNYEQQETQEDRFDTISYLTRKAEQEARNEKAGADVNEATVKTQIQTIKTLGTQEILKNILIGKQTELVGKEMEEIDKKIEKMAADIAQGQERNNIEGMRMMVNKFAEEMRAAYPGIMNVTGNVIDKGLRTLHRLVGSNPDREQKKADFYEKE